MRAQAGIRALAAALCVAGAVASFIAFRSEERLEDSMLSVLNARSHGALETLESSGTLNPDVRRYTGRAWFLASQGDRADAEASMRQAARQEPENAFVWLEWTRMRLWLGRRTDADETYARARELDSQLPRALPGG